MLPTALALVLVGSTLTVGAAADDHVDPPAVPSQSDVRSAEVAVDQGVRDVAAVRADLAEARSDLEKSAVRALQAGEAFNGARYTARDTRRAAHEARIIDRAAQRDLAAQISAFGDLVVAQASSRPELAALQSVLDSDGLDDLLARSASIGATAGAFDARRRALTNAQDAATAAAANADTTAAAALQAQADARSARDRAQAAEGKARRQAAGIAARKGDLLAELARLQGVSVDLATRRQSGLEARAAARAAANAEAAARAQAQAEAAAAAEAHAASAAAAEDEGADAEPVTEAPAPAPAPDPAPAPAPAPPAPAPSPSPTTGNAAAAIAFARAQLGEPYRWAAAGPSAWDCSGLTMGAWSAGGISLPHYSVAQYEASTPISASDLRPGDLVFWGSSGAASSIYHVALYVGNNMIIHAPRTGRPVSEDSLYYWITPNFYARP